MPPTTSTLVPPPAVGTAGSLVDGTHFDSGAPDVQQSATAHRIYRQLISIWTTGLIEAAHDLGIFEHLAVESATSEALAAQLDTDPRATRVLCDALTVCGMLTRSGCDHYAVSADVAACFLEDGLYSLSGKIFYDRTVAWAAWRDLAAAVRRGDRDASGAHQVNQISDIDYEQLVGGINFWAPPVVELLVPWLQQHGWDRAGSRCVLDVGCGTGIYSHLLLRAFPYSKAYGIDVERIIPIAGRQAERLGVADRFTPVVRDFFNDPWPGPADLALFVNIFHLQHQESAQQLLRRTAEALAPGGVVCIVDHIVDRDGPLETPQDRFAMLFAASMLATGGGDAHSLADYDQWLAAAGLRRVDVIDTPMHRMLLAVRDSRSATPALPAANGVHQSNGVHQPNGSHQPNGQH